MNKRTLWGLAILASAWGIAVDTPLFLEGDWWTLTATVVGPAFAVAGAIAGIRRPENRTGALLLLTAFLWPIGGTASWSASGMQIAHVGRWLWTISLIYLVLAFPTGRLQRRKDAQLCWLTSLPAFWLLLIQLPLLNFTYPLSATTLVPPNSKPLSDALDLIGVVLALVCVGMLIARVGDKWRRTAPAGRRALAPVVITGAAALTATALLVLGSEYVRFVQDHIDGFGRITWLTVGTVPMGFLLGLSRARARRARVGELVVELGDLPTPEHFQAALRKALGDPTLVAAFWVPDAQRYLSAEGQTLTLPDDGEASVATFLERDGEPLAVIVHDRFLMEDPGLVAAATAAARLAVENERLQQEVLEQLTEVRASRRRIIEAGDEARRRLERDLHDGAQQRLVTLGLKLQRVATKLGPLDDETGMVLDDARAELKQALTELRGLARGLHPLVLTEEGLIAAVETLSGRFPLPVAIHASDVGRLPEPIETAAYFVVSEALANIAKHANASKVAIGIMVRDDALEVTVEDDGIGGASITAGTGLRGLADRVQALDGNVSISSPTGGGTVITAHLPTAVPEDREETAPVSKEPVLAVRREAAPSERSLLRVRNLDVFYGDQQVLFGVDLDVAAGEMVAVVGTNGAGKSTLARTLAGLQPHLRGSIRFKDQEFTDVDPEHRSRAGLVFVEGGAGVFELLTVHENLRLFARHSGAPLSDGLIKVFDAFPVLASRTSHRAGSISRGEQHMLALARAVMCDVSLVIVDELALGLAPDAVDDLCGHFRRVNEAGTAVLFVEQSITIASRLAGRAYFLDAGRVAFDGHMNDLETSGLLTPIWMAGKKDLAHV